MNRSAMVTCGILLGTGIASAQEPPHLRVGPNVLVSWAGDGAQAELMVGVNPRDTMNLFGAGTHYRTNHPRGGQADRGYYSLDGGYSWNTVRFPEELGAGGGDPQAAFGRTGTAYFSTLSFAPKSGAIHFYRSEDGGITWGKAIDLGAAYDADHIAVDYSSGRFAGRVYISALYGGGVVSHRVGVFRSSDDGRTWTGPVEVANNLGREEFILNQENPLVFNDGGLFLPFIDSPVAGLQKVHRGESPEPFRNHYWCATSEDGGVTFALPHRLTLPAGATIEGPLGHFPMFAIDNSDGVFRDRIYVSWAEWLDKVEKKETGPAQRARKARLFLSHSSDRGKTWSRPRAIDILLDGRWRYGISHQPLQALAVNDDGTLVVTWYDARDTKPGSETLRVGRYVIASVDGGESFSPPVRLSSVSWDAPEAENPPPSTSVSGTLVALGTHGGLPGHGDYLKVATANDGTFHAFWEDARTGSYQIWTARIRLDRESPGSAVEDEKPDLVPADVTGQVEAVLEPQRERPPAHTIELPIRLKNLSTRPIFGPVTVEVTKLTPEGAIGNAENGKTGVGATFDYSRALGDFESLPPGAISEGVVWRFRLPENVRDLPSFRFKVTARIDRAKS